MLLQKESLCVMRCVNLPYGQNSKSLNVKPGGKKVKIEANFTLEQATKAQRGEQMYSSTLPSTSALDRGG